MDRSYESVSWWALWLAVVAILIVGLGAPKAAHGQIPITGIRIVTVANLPAFPIEDRSSGRIRPPVPENQLGIEE